MTVSFDSNVLLNWYQAQANVAAASTNGGVRSTATSASAAAVPTAPWNRRGAIPPDNALVTNALSGRPFVDEKAAKVDVATANGDYKKLFAINQGLATLHALANAAADPTTPSFKVPALQQAFDRGMREISTYVDATKFDNFRLTPGTPTTSETTAGVATAQDTYIGPALVTGSADTVVPSLQGAVQFTMDVTRPANGTNPAKTTTVTFDLSEMGATPRTMNAVTAYMNTKLKAANVGVRVSFNKTTTPEQTITVNGVKSTVSAATNQFGLEITGLKLETVKLSAPTTAPAIYVAQTAGDPDPDGKPTTNDAHQQQELLKLEAGGGADAARRPGDTNYVAGRVFSQKLPDGVSAVHATATDAEGSVYMVADATGAVAGQAIKGNQDAVLLKYDSSGKLVYTRTLGAAATATGATLALSADGKVAIAGQVTGELDAGDSGADAKTGDSFVTVFDNLGQELWTNRQGALGADQAQSVAFDAAGNVYVAGKTQGTIGGGTSAGGVDGYLRAYDATGKVQSTKQFGSAADDSVGGIVVDGTQVLVAGMDGAAAVVRSFDVTNPKQMTLTASRNFGSLGGGAIGGVGLDGAGNLLIGGATSASLSGVATTTLARGGGMDGFGLQISTDLTSTATDAVAYYGGSGTDRATAATVAGGQVWLTGTSKTDLPGMATAVGKQDGFVAALDVGAGAVTYSQRFTAQDRIDAPESISVDTTGGSALDALGLPKGTIQFDSSTLITAATAVRAGDQFQIRMGASRTPTIITIAADDTLATLQAKIQRAGQFEINVSTLNNGSTTQLTLKPANDRQVFELLPGPDGRDALTTLGLKPGLVRNTIVDKTKGVLPADKGVQTYGLRFTSKLDLANTADVKAAIDGIGNAITDVRAIYADLKQAATPKSQQPQPAGSVSAYQQAQIADYTAALNRLTAGDSSSGSSGSSLVSLFG